MVAVVVAPRFENLDSDTETVISNGSFRIRPARAYSSGGQWVVPQWPAPKELNGAAVTVQLDPLASIPYELELTYQDGSGAPYSPPNEFRIVTASGTPVAWETLVQVSGPGGGAVLTDVVDARLDALEAAVGGVSGGASNLASITDMSAFMRTVNDDTSAGAARTTLGAADATAVVNLTGDQSVAGIKTFASSPIVPPPTTSGQAAPKSYVDSQAASGTPDATTIAKGKIQLAGDLAGTAASPTVPGLATISTALTALTTRVAALESLFSAGRLTYAAAPLNSRFDLPCPGGVQPTRPTAPADVSFDIQMIAEPSTAAGYATVDDGWIREAT